METTTSITDKIIDGLKRAAVELEKFRLQAALGKAEAREAYEDAKKIFGRYAYEAKTRLASVRELAKDESSLLKSSLEMLQVHMTLGKAESKQAFEEQARKITKILNEIEAVIKKNKATDLCYAEFQMEIEKFRIKLDILKLEYELNKMGVKEEFEEKKNDFSKKLSELEERLLEKGEVIENTWEHFKDEISEAYDHLKKVFVKYS